jgi:serine phosphatase RsbU (regulator of sigma subunit)/anti-sigma regulatory factor (Ser/Thr protein kinase)
MQENEQRRLSAPCSFENVRSLTEFAREACAGLLSEAESSLVELAVAEAANNIVEHSYKDSQGWPIEICVRLYDGSLDFLIADSGLPFDHSRVQTPKFDWPSVQDVPEHGRGLFLINAIMDKVSFSRRGEVNLCMMSKSVRDRSQAELSVDRAPAEEPPPFVCDCADPFHFGFKKSREEEKSSSKCAGVSSCALFGELGRALSLHTAKAELFGRLASALRETMKAESCQIHIVERDSLVKEGESGVSASQSKSIRLDSTELEAQTAAMRRELSGDFGAQGFRLCVPLSGLGRLIGVATLNFASRPDFELAKNEPYEETLSVVSTIVENHLLHEKALDAERSRKDMETATNLHKGVISMLVPNMRGLKIFAKNQPALELGGDYLSFHKVSDENLWFIICDAMGKGISASFFSILSHMTFQSSFFLQEDISPGELLTNGNKIMAKDFDRFEMFMTAFVGRIDLAKGVLDYACAGHCPPIIHQRGAGASLLDTEDFMLGVDYDIAYKTFSIPFPKGTSLIAYTDGLTDIVGPNGEMIGVEPLMKSCAQLLESGDVIKTCGRIFKAATSPGNELQDDITLLGVESV